MDDKRGTGPRLPDSGRLLSEAERESYEWRGRIESKLDTQTSQLSEIFAQLRRLDCGEHRHRLEKLEARVATLSVETPRKPPSGETRKPPTSPAYRAVTRADLDDTARHVLEEAEDAAERTVEDRLEALEKARAKAREELLGNWRWAAKAAQVIIMSLVAIGASIVARCEMTKQPQQIQQRNHQAPASRPGWR